MGIRVMWYLCCQHCDGGHRRHGFPCEIPDCLGGVPQRSSPPKSPRAAAAGEVADGAP
jgi:hypothetical protein